MKNVPFGKAYTNQIRNTRPNLPACMKPTCIFSKSSEGLSGSQSAKITRCFFLAWPSIGPAFRLVKAELCFDRIVTFPGGLEHVANETGVFVPQNSFTSSSLEELSPLDASWFKSLWAFICDHFLFSAELPKSLTTGTSMGVNLDPATTSVFRFSSAATRSLPSASIGWKCSPFEFEALTLLLSKVGDAVVSGKRKKFEYGQGLSGHSTQRRKILLSADYNLYPPLHMLVISSSSWSLLPPPSSRSDWCDSNTYAERKDHILCCRFADTWHFHP